MSSLRRRFTWSFAAVLLVVAAAVGLLVQQLVRDALVAQFDFGLHAKASALAALLELDGPVLEFDDALGSMPEYADGRTDEAFAIWGPDGQPLTHSRSLADFAVPRRAGADGAAASWDLSLPDGRSARALGLVAVIGPDEDLPPVAPEDLPRVTVVVVRDRSELDARLTTVGLGLLGALAAALALGAWGLSLTVRRGLEPLDRLGNRVAAIDAAHLDTRLGVAGLPDELQPLADKLDELLERLEAAFGRQRRMTAAMAHELRTPIAELRSATDVARRWPEDGELTGDALVTAGDVAARMGRSIDAVMHLCRLEAGQESLEPADVALRAAVDEVWSSYAEHAATRRVELANELDEAAVLHADPRLLGLVLRNLLDNAASFSSPGRVRVWSDPARGVLLGVENPATELGDADLARLAEPFWRKDDARSDGAHSGLGLTLVHAVAAVLGLEVRFALRDGTLRAELAARSPRRHVRSGSSG